jgi:Na+-driven multidrug efflux pump
MLDSQQKANQMPKTDKEIAKEIIKSTSQILVTLIAFYLIEVITMAFTGHLGDSAILAGAGLGSM